jgi:hypothetical protein
MEVQTKLVLKSLKRAYRSAIYETGVIRPAANAIVVVHIGKAGGTTFLHELRKAGIKIQPKVHLRAHSAYWFWHVPPSQFPLTYITLRNPMDRLISAYFWSHHWRDRSPKVHQRRNDGHEAALLRHCSTLDAFIDSLEVNMSYRIMPHVKQDIAFYTKRLLRHCPADRLRVVCCETMNDDLQRHFGVLQTVHRNNNAYRKTVALSAARVQKLRAYLADEYRCIDTMRRMGLLNDAQYAHLSRQHPLTQTPPAPPLQTGAMSAVRSELTTETTAAPNTPASQPPPPPQDSQ